MMRSRKSVPLWIAAMLLAAVPVTQAMSQDASEAASGITGSWWTNASSVSRVTSQVKAFFGGALGHYLAGNGTIDFQFETVLLSKHEASVDLKDGDTLLSSSLESDPAVRSALLVGPDGAVKAAGLLHHACAPAQDDNYACDAASQPTLTIFVPTYSADDRVQNVFVVSRVREWALRAVRHSGAKGDEGPVKLKIQVRELNPARNV